MLKEYFGSRAKIGVIYMTSGFVLEPEFAAMAPKGVSVHYTRIFLPVVTVKGLAEMMKPGGVEQCTRYLAEAPLDVIAFGGTSATFLFGMGYDEKIRRRIVKASGGIPATTTSTAALRALRAVGAKRMAMVTPYVDEVTERGRVFFSDNGFDVVSARGLGIAKDLGIGSVTIRQVYDFTVKSVPKDADSVFLSCTNLRAIGAIPTLEKKLGIPVVSAIQATMWDCLRLAGVPTKDVKGFGSLFRANASPARIEGRRGGRRAA